MSKFGDDIRRIAKTKALEERIKEAQEKINLLTKAAIEARRGIAYLDPQSNTVGSTESGAPGETTPDNNGGGTYAFPPLGDSSNSRGNQQDSETFDGDDLLTGADKPNLGDKISELQLKDCDTGEAINVNISPISLTPDSNPEQIFKPPELWENSVTPPYTEQFEAGFFWSVAGQGNSATPYEAGEAYMAFVATIGGGSPTFPNPRVVSITNFDDNGADLNWTYDDAPGETTTNMNKTVCPGGAVDYCPSQLPTEFEWPKTTPHQLAFNGEKGGFFSSQYDTTIPSKYKRTQNENDNGFKKIDACTQDGLEVTVEAAKDGGFYYYQNDGFGSPDTSTYDIQNFSADGKYQGTVSEDRYNFLED